jgi:hypothetical protein
VTYTRPIRSEHVLAPYVDDVAGGAAAETVEPPMGEARTLY